MVSLKKFKVVSVTTLLSVNCLVIINLMSKFKIVARNPDDNGNSTYSSAQSIPSISMEISKRNGKLTVNLFRIENFMTFQARCWNFTLNFDFTNIETCYEVAIFYRIVVCVTFGCNALWSIRLQVFCPCQESEWAEQLVGVTYRELLLLQQVEKTVYFT